ncbi:MAG: hypothetical protein M3Q69_05175 [Acidobacteriota bacterium]|nr:hypothetical protein [Acidobacteriota bacterium]
MSKTTPLLAALAYAGAAFLFGLALGERGELGFVQYVFASVIPLTSLILAVIAKRGRAFTILTGAAMLAGLLLGQRQFARAFDECIVTADRARNALLARSGDYPAHLGELGIDVPCRCGLRDTILHYLANDRGFRLWFTNDAQTFVATDRHPLTASGRSSGRRDN